MVGSLSNVQDMLHTKKEVILLDDLFFGARDGTRTHTA